MAKIAINGLGRIGRATFKLILKTPGLELAAVNDLLSTDHIAYLLKYDTVYGKYETDIGFDKDNIIVDGKKYRVYSEKDPSKLPWKDLDIDLVFECTGLFTKKEDLEKHIQAGAKKVILSAPSKSEELITVVHGVNKGNPTDQIISCASCTTNSITPVVEIMSRRIGIKKAILNTVHAYTSSQSLVDGPNKNKRRGRAAAANIVPTSTGAAIATTKVLPQYKGKFDGIALRVPVFDGSIADMVFLSEKNTSIEEVNQIFKEEAASDRYRGILGITEDPFVSSDIIQDPRASVVDLGLTQVVDGDLVRVMCWYDNEWGYTNQIIREALNVLEIK